MLLQGIPCLGTARTTSACAFCSQQKHTHAHSCQMPHEWHRRLCVIGTAHDGQYSLSHVEPPAPWRPTARTGAWTHSFDGKKKPNPAREQAHQQYEVVLLTNDAGKLPAPVPWKRLLPASDLSLARVPCSRRSSLPEQTLSDLSKANGSHPHIGHVAGVITSPSSKCQMEGGKLEWTSSGQVTAQCQLFSALLVLALGPKNL
mmetsp:Transcript_64999/g.172025  ORF Transcript_64999/g.172025 Transcript_64999/m.172025 type:complete len:202 (+) Transcript_64999:87-692(+)